MKPRHIYRSVVTSKHRYIDPQTGEILVDVGDLLTRDTVTFLGVVKAIRAETKSKAKLGEATE